MLAEHEITHVVHLAALQVPFVRENPVLGSQVNVTGTVNVFEAAKRLGLETTIAYASSAAVYDRDGNVAPSTLYGVFKLANEGTASIYAAESGLASVGLRPFTVYGPGRDQGLTAGPTLAIAAAVRGEPYRIAFGGRYAVPLRRRRRRRLRPGGALGAGRRADLLHRRAGDADRRLRCAGRARSAGAARSRSTTRSLPFPDQLPEPWFDAPLTPLEEGVRETAAILRSVV